MSYNIETANLWFKKAENDLKIGKDELETKEPATDAICFHMQQCVEKFLKGYLVFYESEIEKTHDIAAILQKCIIKNNSFIELRELGIDELTPYGTTIRYPDDFYMPELDETLRAIKLADTTRNFVLRIIESLNYK
jgi:HEPN domain-containing protein